MKPYTEYKASGIDWLGEIPTHWTLPKIQYIFEFVSGNGFPIELQGQVVGEYPFYKTSDINDSGCYASAPANYISQRTVDEYKFNIIPTGGIIMSKIGVALLKNHRKIATNESIIDNNLQALILKDEIHADIKFLYYFMKFFDMAWVMNDGTVPSVNNNQLRQSFISLPPLEEQESIAKYLDDVTGRIDTLINEKTQQADELRAYRSSLITETVTRGLNPDVPLRDSGIDWLGSIPNHWQVSKLKYIGEAKNGLTYSPEDICDADKGILVLRSSNIQNENLCFEDNVYVSKIVDELLMEEGDILICSRNGSASLVGKSAIIPAELRATFGAFMMRFRSNINKRYSLYLIRVALANNRKLYATSTINQLTNSMIGNINVPIAPETEQQEIVDFLDEKTAKMDRLIEELTKQLDELAEYKQAVITEAVTGKVDVRNYKKNS